MKTLFFGCFLIFVIISGCDKSGIADSSTSADPSISADISWTQDVTSINMTGVGVTDPELSQNSIHELKSGKGTIYWISSGTEYSRTIDVGNVDEDSDDNIECEQEGENEGENEGCLFSFNFSGSELSISN